MTITQLQVLIKTVELGSFTKAARVLNMTQPAVSHAISSIESELGVTILIRDKRKRVTRYGCRKQNSCTY